ncbi:methyl-accepting chemotaxis protein [Psychrosphaera sp. 1_MG-2023]|uniref:methyl-accepting chemotaxis protein n=1 Tax=Psychrosphaera sp. 1_MG-2023 TaxID=3062643 RepID=UPI0026E23A0F|nr:methyl-accepting chemotaxis protein [Psychrosphaera sp. 1_MG-2023]MDO6720986.1 methyl-accepting chemotaxis protein [Psychrosphaera sp. 1_MG-2023]
MQYPWLRKANKTFIYVIISQLVFGLVIGLFNDSFTQALIIGGIIAAFPLLLLTQKPYETITRHCVAIAIQLATALHIHLAQGLTEIHFEIFSLLAILIFYRDWKVILTSVLVVAVHHVLFFILQLQNMPVYVFEAGHLAVYILVIHALFAVIEGCILMYIAKDSHDEGVAAYAVQNSIHQILAHSGKFDLTVPIPNQLPALNEYNRLIMSFKSLIEQTKNTANTALTATQQAVDTSTEMMAYSEQGTGQVESIARSVENMAMANSDISNRAKDVSDSAKSAQGSTLEIQETITHSHQTIRQLKEIISSTAGTIENLSSKCNRITEVMTSITAISDQTNLLALNAAIESARAGEHGRGFAVVADEVRQLATKTRENAQGISEIVQTLIEDASLSVTQMGNCISQVDQAVEQSERMSDTANKVVSSIKLVADNITSVADATVHQSDVSDAISSATQEMQNLSSILDQNISLTQQEMQNLQLHIGELNDELQKFEV